jgi:DnaK suppressor protein
VTDLTNTDLTHFEGLLREQRTFRLEQLAALSRRDGYEVTDAGTGEVAEVLEHAAKHALAEIELALDRLRCGRYGRCIDCGEAIGRDRLDVLPSAARCTQCQHRITSGRPPPRPRTTTRERRRTSRGR